MTDRAFQSSFDCRRHIRRYKEYTPRSSTTIPVIENKTESPPLETTKELPTQAVEGEVEDDWETDPTNARNWPKRKKWIMVTIVSFYTFIPPLASSMMAPGLPEVAEMYNITNETITALTLSIFLVSFAIGPLILAPLSEMYGRTWILHLGNIFSLAFNLGCAFSPNTPSLIAFRFLNGFSGAAPIAVGGGSIGDLFSERERAFAMSLYTLGPLIAPAMGPVAGGFLAEKVGVKYVFIVIAATCGLASLLGIPFLRETYAPVLQRRKAARLLATGHPENGGHRPNLPKTVPTPAEAQGISKSQYLWLNLSRPVVLLTRSFICFILSLYMSFVYAVYYLMFATFAKLFHDNYGFSPGTGGLVYLGLGTGFMIATYFGASISDGVYLKLTDKNGGKGKPEYRIPPLIFGSFFIPIGLFWYGWSAQTKAHWIVPIIGSGVFGFGQMTCFLPITLYLVDAFTYAASALSAASVLRSLLGFAFPLFAQDMYDKLGYGVGNSVLGGLAIILGIPFPIWIWYKGEEVRARSDLNR
ncbi:multidrug resistance protein 4 [Marasmius fiardii PR-910]|nr:multidrug resistance protein 4 [Marasmius fiardii PR-910]